MILIILSRPMDVFDHASFLFTLNMPRYSLLTPWPSVVPTTDTKQEVLHEEDPGVGMKG